MTRLSGWGIKEWTTCGTAGSCLFLRVVVLLIVTMMLRVNVVTSTSQTFRNLFHQMVQHRFKSWESWVKWLRAFWVTSKAQWDFF